MSEVEAVDLFITDAMIRGIIPMHVAADLSQYLVEEWSAKHPALPRPPRVPRALRGKVVPEWNGEFYVFKPVRGC